MHNNHKLNTMSKTRHLIHSQHFAGKMTTSHLLVHSESHARELLENWRPILKSISPIPYMLMLPKIHTLQPFSKPLGKHAISGLAIQMCHPVIFHHKYNLVHMTHTILSWFTTCTAYIMASCLATHMVHMLISSDSRSSSKLQKRLQLDWTNHQLHGNQDSNGPVAFSFWKIKNQQKTGCNWSKLQPVASKNIPPCRYHFLPFTIVFPQF